MWCSYIAELLNLHLKPTDPASGAEESKTELKMPPSITMQSKLVKAEFHGAIIEGIVHSAILAAKFFNTQRCCTVTQSKNKSLIGCKGIIIHETENTFKVVTSSDVLKGVSRYMRRSAGYLTIPTSSLISNP